MDIGSFPACYTALKAACPAVELCTKHRGLFSCSFLLGTAIIASQLYGVNAENTGGTKESR